MTDVNISLHYNDETQEVELKVGDEVVGSSGPDYFEHWAKLWAEKNGYSKQVVSVETPVEEKVVEVTPEETPEASDGVDKTSEV